MSYPSSCQKFLEQHNFFFECPVQKGIMFPLSFYNFPCLHKVSRRQSCYCPTQHYKSSSVRWTFTGDLIIVNMNTTVHTTHGRLQCSFWKLALKLSQIMTTKNDLIWCWKIINIQKILFLTLTCTYDLICFNCKVSCCSLYAQAGHIFVVDEGGAFTVVPCVEVSAGPQHEWENDSWSFRERF